RPRRQGAPAVEVLFDFLVAERRGEGPLHPLPHLAQHDSPLSRWLLLLILSGQPRRSRSLLIRARGSTISRAPGEGSPARRGGRRRESWRPLRSTGCGSGRGGRPRLVPPPRPPTSCPKR